MRVPKQDKTQAGGAGVLASFPIPRGAALASRQPRLGRRPPKHPKAATLSHFLTRCHRVELPLLGVPLESRLSVQQATAERGIGNSASTTDPPRCPLTHPACHTRPFPSHHTERTSPLPVRPPFGDHPPRPPGRAHTD